MPDYESQLALMKEILEYQFSEDFVRKMKARVFVGYHRYGQSKQYAIENKYDILETIKKRLEKYRETGNKEHLVDAANFIMIEYMYPQHPDAHFESIEEEDPSKRVGLVKAAETLLRLDDENKKTIIG